MSETTNKGNNFMAYEYKDVTVKKTMQAVYADSYENFGWTLEGTSDPVGKIDSITMKYKRDRKIRNKAEITRLQRQFDACVAEVLRLESSKKIKAAAVAYVVGVIGTAFMAGSVFAVTTGNVGACVVLSIPAFIGWIIPYLLFRSISGKKTLQVNPLIEQKYDELYTICEKANRLLN